MNCFWVIFLVVYSSVCTWHIKHVYDFKQYGLKDYEIKTELQKAWDFEILCVEKGLAKYNEDGNIILVEKH